MELAAEDLRFEDAARYRDQLSSIEKIQEKQRMVTQRGDLDVLGLAVTHLWPVYNYCLFAVVDY